MQRIQNSTQRGAFLLSMVLIITMIIALTLTSYLVILTHLTHTSYNLVFTEQSYNAAFAGLKDSLIHALADTDWPPDDVFEAPDSELGNSQITRTVTKDGDQLIFEITGNTRDLPRKLHAVLAPPTIQTATADIMLVLDISDSMNTVANSSSSETKLTKAKQAATDFITSFQANTTTRIGVVYYATLTSLLTPPNPPLTYSQGFPQLKSGINNLTTAGSTNIGGGLQLAKDTLLTNPDPETQLYAVLLTDGIPTVNSQNQWCGDTSLFPNGQSQVACLTEAQQYAINQAEEAKTQNITVFTIGLGTGSEINSDLLLTMATQISDLAGTRRLYFPAPNANDLQGIYLNIAKTIQGPGILTFEEIEP